jgi:hypothetical protein
MKINLDNISTTLLWCITIVFCVFCICQCEQVTAIADSEREQSRDKLTQSLAEKGYRFNFWGQLEKIK